MMTLFPWVLATSALAEAPLPPDPVDDGTRIDALTWARPVVFRTPVQASVGAEPVLEGWLVQLSVDPNLLAPAQGRSPNLFAGETPVLRFNWDPTGGCAVGFVPGAMDPETTPFFFGTAELTERMDATRRHDEARAAEDRGVRPRSAAEVDRALAAGGGPLHADDLRDAHRIAMARVALCTATPADLERSGIPDAPRP